MKIFGHELILNGRRNNIAMISEFMGLPEVQNGWEIKFTMSERDYEDLRVVEQMIGEKAKLLVRRHSKRELTFSSLTEFGASVFQRQLGVPVTREVSLPEEPGPTNTNKRRKTSDELGPKQLSNCGKDIMSMIVENTGNSVPDRSDKDAEPLIAGLNITEYLWYRYRQRKETYNFGGV